MRVFITMLLGGALALAAFAGASGPANSAASVKVCGSGNGHGVGMSQYGAYGRAVAGQGYQKIIKSYYRDVSLKRYANNPPVRVLLSEKATGGRQDVVVANGRQARFRNLATGYAKALGPGRYGVKYLPAKKLYRVIDLSRGKAIGSYRGPIRFERVKGPLRYAGTDYRGIMLVKLSESKLRLINRLPLEGYIRGVVPLEMPSSWHQQALRAQTVAARSYARAGVGGGPFDFYSDTRSQVYGGLSAETTATNNAVNATSRIVAVHNGSPITAFFHSSAGGRTEDSRYIFSASQYLKSVRDADGSGRAFERRVNSPWMRWTGKLNADGSSLGVGRITSVSVLEKSPSGRATKVRVRGTNGTKILSGHYDIRYGLKQTGLRRADGSSYPGGILPSTRVKFGSSCP